MIVLESFGKGKDVKSIRIKLFFTKRQAKEYCDKQMLENNTSLEFWQTAEMIDENTMYELKQFKNIKYDNRTKEKTKS
jgi:hypothetical protein